MRKIVFFCFIVIGLNAFPQSACQGVIVGERISLTYAQSYLESLRKEAINEGYKNNTPITDTFQLVDICVVDSVVIIELKLQKNHDASDTTTHTSPSYYILSKNDCISTKGNRMEVAQNYYLSIIPYYSHDYIVNIGSPGMPIILNNTAYQIWFEGNIYHSREIQGNYYLGKVWSNIDIKYWEEKCDTMYNWFDILWFWQDQYFNLFFEYPDSVDKAFDFHEDETMQYLPKNWKKILSNHKSDFDISSSDTTLDVCYKGEHVVKFSNNIRCKNFTTDKYRNYCIRGIYEDGTVMCTESLTEEYKKRIKQLIVSMYEIYGYSVVYLPSIKTINNIPPYILYEYNPSSGLTVHKICQCEYQIKNNIYTDKLKEFAKIMCETYGFSRLLFTSIIMNDGN